MNVYIWLAVFIILIIFELLTLSLTTIWFAAGSIVALILDSLGFSIWVQLIAFLLVSFLILIRYRPLAKEYINKKITKTNYNALIGKKAVVIEKIDNIKDVGRATINGIDWRARSVLDEVVIEEGATVKIIKIEGATLIVDLS